jgi:CubicO group peptidase (beta-lactamase class C family)
MNFNELTSIINDAMFLSASVRLLGCFLNEIEMNKNDETKIRRFLENGVGAGVFPGAVLMVAQGDEIAFREAVGYRCLIPEHLTMEIDTIFDLASLTKPLATTLALMKLVESGKIGLDRPLANFFLEPLPEDKGVVTTRLLLCHSAGFTHWKPFYLELVNHEPAKRKGMLRKRILQEPLAYPPGDKVLYSDLGFMILEWIIEESSGMTLPRYLARHFYGPLSLKKTFFVEGNHQNQVPKQSFASTEDCPWRNKVIRGEVHDENAHALDGYSGHAGLFGTVDEVYQIVNLLREHFLGRRQDDLKPQTVRDFFTRQDNVKGSSWALGWDTPSLEGSSAGRYFSRNSVGHLGFTGTSVWMDLEKDVIVILLTNRIHPTRKNEKIREFRPKLHDLIMEELF